MHPKSLDSSGVNNIPLAKDNYFSYILTMNYIAIATTHSHHGHCHSLT